MSDDLTINDTQQPHENASDAVKRAQAEAKVNAKKDQAGAPDNTQTLEDNIEDAQDTARENHKVDAKNQPESTQEGFENDTSDRAKIDATKAQLDPTGSDPNVSDAEIKRAALDGASVKGGTSVTNKENARRALESTDDSKPNTGATEDAAGNPTLGHGENAPADADATHPNGGKADQSANTDTTDPVGKS